MNAPFRPHDADPVLDLRIERSADARSRLADRHVRFPWSVGRGYPGPPGAPVVLIPQCAGAGLLSGDSVQQRLRVGDNAALDLHSAGAMLTYGRPGGRTSVSDWTLDLGAGSRTRFFSEPYVLLDHADLMLRQIIIADTTAELVAIEGVTYAGDVGTIGWQTQTSVYRPDGKILFVDRQCATPDLLKRVRKLPGSWRAFGTMIVLTASPEQSLCAADRAAREFEGKAYVAATSIAGNIGVCARIAAPDGQTLRETMRQLMSTVEISKTVSRQTPGSER